MREKKTIIFEDVGVIIIIFNMNGSLVVIVF